MGLPLFEAGPSRVMAETALDDHEDPRPPAIDFAAGDGAQTELTATSGEELGLGNAEAPAYPSSEDDAGRAGLSTPRATLRCLEERLCIPIQMPLVRGPPRLRKPRTPATTQSVRRSRRIAEAPREVDSTMQAQRVLMKKLGVAPPSPSMGPDTAILCRNAFRQPLSEAAHDNLQKLLGANFDPIEMNLNMLGLEDGPPLLV